MAPSNKLIALLVAFAVIMPSSLPLSAARNIGAAKDAAAAPAPSAASGGEVLYPMNFFDDIGDVIGDIIHFRLPDLPLPAILPCPPDFPIKIPFLPCHNVTKPVTECRSSLAKYMPACAGFLTGGGASSSPQSKCCDAINPFFDDKSTTPLCLCHVVNGDLGKLLPAPMNHTRANSFLQQCGLDLTPDKVTKICANEDDVFNIPPMDAPSPPPTWRHH
ncbi:unnamed protein product [Urochloa humidicola]